MPANWPYWNTLLLHVLSLLRNSPSTQVTFTFSHFKICLCITYLCFYRSKRKMSYPHGKFHRGIFLKKIGGHGSFLWDQWYPCFGLLTMSAMGFKARVDLWHACNGILRFTSGTDLLATRILLRNSILWTRGVVLSYFNAFDASNRWFQKWFYKSYRKQFTFRNKPSPNDNQYQKRLLQSNQPITSRQCDWNARHHLFALKKDIKK